MSPRPKRERGGEKMLSHVRCRNHEKVDFEAAVIIMKNLKRGVQRIQDPHTKKKQSFSIWTRLCQPL